jgi:hypothetical protein
MLEKLIYSILLFCLQNFLIFMFSISSIIFFELAMVLRYMDELVGLLRVFREALCMEINWEESYAYWFDKYMHKP